MDRRRFLVTSLAGVLGAPLAAMAQQPPKRPRIALLFANTPIADVMGSTPKDRSAKAFLEGMRALGWLDGTNITIERRSAEGKLERYPSLIQEFVTTPVDLIVTAASAAVPMIKQASNTMPIVLAGYADSDILVQQRLIDTLARPGGSVTGLTLATGPELRDKQLQLLKEAVPKAGRIAYLAAPPLNPPTEAARGLKVKLVPVSIAASDELEGAFAALKREGADAVLLGGSLVFYSNRRRIVDLAASHRLPVMYWNRIFVEAEGLMSYGADWADLFRAAAGYVDKILKGVKPGDLPIEQPTKFELVINLRTAKALGLTIPPSLLARADLMIGP